MCYRLCYPHILMIIRHLMIDHLTDVFFSGALILLYFIFYILFLKK
jgi:hypothetical protein